VVKFFLRLVPTLRPEVGAALSACVGYALLGVNALPRATVSLRADWDRGEQGQTIFFIAILALFGLGLSVPFVALLLRRRLWPGLEILQLFMTAVGLFCLCAGAAGAHIEAAGAYADDSIAWTLHLLLAILGFAELFVIILGALQLADSPSVRKHFFGTGDVSIGLLRATFLASGLAAVVHRGLHIADPTTASFLAANAVLISSRLHIQRQMPAPLSSE
jgi:hypothetical protein